MAEFSESASQRAYRHDAGVLGEVGSVLAKATLPRIEVRLPKRLGEAAVAAWDREDGEGPSQPETPEQWIQRHQAATLALIGLSIVNVGRWENDEIVVDLSPELIGIAVDALDDFPSR